MRTNFLLLFFVLYSSALTAQNSPVDKLFNKYSGKDGFTTVLISQYMFDMFKDVDTNDKDFDNLIKGLKSIRIITVEDPKLIAAGINFYKEIMKDLPASEYKELMVIKEKGQDVKFMVKETQGRISELLLISGGKNNNTFICIQGNIDLKSIAKLSKSMNIQGMKSLEQVGDKK
jgi:hypothetical protein